MPRLVSGLGLSRHSRTNVPLDTGFDGSITRHLMISFSRARESAGTKIQETKSGCCRKAMASHAVARHYSCTSRGSPASVRRPSQGVSARKALVRTANVQGGNMDNTTLLIILIVVIIVLGG